MHSVAGLWQALFATHKYIRLNDEACRCNACGGVGYVIVEPHRIKRTCESCAGVGADVNYVMNTISDRVSNYSPYLTYNVGAGGVAVRPISLEELVATVLEEPVLVDDMPDELYDKMLDSKEAANSICRLLVSTTVTSIHARLMELLASHYTHSEPLEG